MGKRIKTRYIGIYYRFGERRFLTNGKPDKCYDIHYKSGNKYIFEKVGWISEGYTIDNAIELRGLRVKALRHPELSDQSAKKRKSPTVNEIWEIYKVSWLPRLKNSGNCLSMYEFHIQPQFGNKKVEDITSLDIENFKNKMLSADTKFNTLRKPGTVKKVLKFFKAIIAKANSWGLTHGSQYNPVGKVDIKDSDAQRERYLTPQEAEKLLEACQDVSCQIYFIACIGLYTGMRLGEILSLSQEQVNIDAGIITLNGKTGRRPAYIPDEIKPIFAKLLIENSGGLLFHGADGNELKSPNISVRFARIVDTIRLNDGITDTLNKVVFHTLRHTYCSWLAIEGVPLYTIGQLVGHSKPEMTQRYAKLSPDSKRTAIQGIGKMLGSTTTD